MLKFLQFSLVACGLLGSTVCLAQTAPFHGKCVLLIEGPGVELGNQIDFIHEPAVALLRKDLGDVSGATLTEVQAQCASSADHYFNDPKLSFFERYARTYTDGFSLLTTKVVSSIHFDKKSPHLVVSYTELKEDETAQEFHISANEN